MALQGIRANHQHAVGIQDGFQRALYPEALPVLGESADAFGYSPIAGAVKRVDVTGAHSIAHKLAKGFQSFTGAQAGDETSYATGSLASFIVLNLVTDQFGGIFPGCRFEVSFFVSNKRCGHPRGFVIDLLETPHKTELSFESGEVSPIDTHYVVILDQDIGLAADPAKAARAAGDLSLACSAPVGADLAENGACRACLQTGSAGYAG